MEGSHLRGSLPDLGGILVQSLEASNDLLDAFRGEGPSKRPSTSRESSATDAETTLPGSRAYGIPSRAKD